MAGRRIKISGKMLFTWFILAGLILVLLPESVTNNFHFAFARIFRLPLSVSRNFSLSARTAQPLESAVSLTEHQRLQNHLANLEEQLAQERRQVERLTGERTRLPFEYARLIPADVIKTLVSGPQNEIIINRGLKDGIKKGQMVVGDNSIVGLVADVSSLTSKVKLLTDSTSSIEAKVADMKVVVKGAGNNLAKITLVPVEKKIKTGDVVWAAKKPGLLDAGMIIGIVQQCKKDAESPLLWDITVRPACNLDRLSMVDVLIMNPAGR